MVETGEKEGGQDLTQLLAAVEAVLFAAPRPISIKGLCSIFQDYDAGLVRDAVEALRSRYQGAAHGVELHEVAGGLVIRTKPCFKDHVLRARQKGPVRISRAAMETLALVAYKQPVTRAEIEAIRGVDSSGTLRFLMERRLIRIQGRKDVPGRPLLYGTTRQFLELFQLKDLKSLPDSSELKELELLSKGQLSLFDAQKKEDGQGAAQTVLEHHEHQADGAPSRNSTDQPPEEQPLQ